MAISTNRPRHLATDVSDWGPTFQKMVSTFFKHPRHLLPGILRRTKIVSRDKSLNGN